MRLIHVLNTHLGFNDLDAINTHDIKQRDTNFHDAFTQAIEPIKILKPDYIIHKGGLFHRSHSSYFTPAKVALLTNNTLYFANLVLRIVISKTLSELSSASSVGFLAFEEVFGSQDESRQMEIIRSVSCHKRAVQIDIFDKSRDGD